MFKMAKKEQRLHKVHHIIFISRHISAGHESDGHNFFAVADEDEFGGFLVVSPEGMSDVGEREHLQHFHRIIC